MDSPEASFLQNGHMIANAEVSQMFGKKCFKIGGKAFVCFFQECMVFKLSGEEHKGALALDGATLFDPSGKGRPMKQWVQVPHQHSVVWEKLAASAAKFAGSV